MRETTETAATADSPNALGPALRVFMRFASPRILTALLILAAGARLAMGPGSWWELLIPVGLLAVWPLVEWGIHVHMLHYRPVTLFGRRWDFLLAQTHRAHHQQPWILQRVFVPLHVYPLTLPFLIVIPLLVYPTTTAAVTFMLSVAVLSLHYEWVHYLAHVRYCPNLGYYRSRVREHRLHHFRDERRWWGVSMGQADHWLGTAPKPTDVKKSPTTHDICPGAKATPTPELFTLIS